MICTKCDCLGHTLHYYPTVTIASTSTPGQNTLIQSTIELNEPNPWKIVTYPKNKKIINGKNSIPPNQSTKFTPQTHTNTPNITITNPKVSNASHIHINTNINIPLHKKITFSANESMQDPQNIITNPLHAKPISESHATHTNPTIHYTNPNSTIPH